MPPLRRFALGAAALALAFALWLPSLRLVYRPRESTLRPPDNSLAPRARGLLARQMALWESRAIGAHETERMRASNAEWDFMGRTYLALALANAALRDPPQTARYVALLDRVIEDTLRHEREDGMYYFLMPYARAKPWVFAPARSVFVDGEIAMMLGARRMVRDDRADYREALVERARRITEQMRASALLSAESYPDECWTFCNTLGLAALRVHDALDHTDHGDLRREWVALARARLIDAKTGLLVSSYTLDGEVRDGPEGSSIYMAAHDLLLVDRDFARDQYARAHRHLNRELLGFGYALEWPDAARGREDVDSGPTVPLVGANAGASGMALLGAGAFNDTSTLAGLVASLDLAAFPIEDETGLRYAASNAVGDSVLLYALVEGPLWQAVEQRSPP